MLASAGGRVGRRPLRATTATAAAARCKSAAASPAAAAPASSAASAASATATATASSEKVQSFKIYRWDPNEKVRNESASPSALGTLWAGRREPPDL